MSAAFQGRTCQIAASLDYGLCPVVVLHLNTTPEIQVFDKGASSDYNFRETVGRYDVVKA